MPGCGINDGDFMKKERGKRKFKDSYPNIDYFVHSVGRVDIGGDSMDPAFIRATDEGGNVWDSGKKVYKDLDSALEDLEKGLEKRVREVGR